MSNLVNFAQQKDAVNFQKALQEKIQEKLAGSLQESKVQVASNLLKKEVNEDIEQLEEGVKITPEHSVVHGIIHNMNYEKAYHNDNDSNRKSETLKFMASKHYKNVRPAEGSYDWVDKVLRAHKNWKNGVTEQYTESLQESKTKIKVATKLFRFPDGSEPHVHYGKDHTIIAGGNADDPEDHTQHFVHIEHEDGYPNVRIYHKTKAEALHHAKFLAKNPLEAGMHLGAAEPEFRTYKPRK